MCLTTAHRNLSNYVHTNKVRSFTLVEILIVLVIVGLIVAVATPKLMEKSDQFTIDQALNDLRTTVNETAMRSRATGQILTLTLNTDTHTFTLSPGTDNLVHSWQPPAPQLSEDMQERQRSFINVKSTYKHPEEIQWELNDNDLNDDGNLVLTFFPDGQAAAREIAFTLLERKYLFSIDKITAAPTILEVLD